MRQAEARGCAIVGEVFLYQRRDALSTQPKQSLSKPTWNWGTSVQVHMDPACTLSTGFEMWLVFGLPTVSCLEIEIQVSLFHFHTGVVCQFSVLSSKKVCFPGWMVSM